MDTLIAESKSINNHLLKNLKIVQKTEIDKERIKKNISSFLWDYMNNAMFTQKEFSEFLEIPQGHISKYINGKDIPRYVVISQMANKMGVKVDLITNYNKETTKWVGFPKEFY